MKQRRADAIDKEFIKETYGDPSWSPESIAETLDLHVQTVYRWGSAMGVKRDGVGITPRSNWRAIWNAYNRTDSYTFASRETGYSVEVVKYAVKRMKAMPRQKRRDTWARYERSLGLR